jgi:hypothetical protein
MFGEAIGGSDAKREKHRIGSKHRYESEWLKGHDLLGIFLLAVLASDIGGSSSEPVQADTGFEALMRWSQEIQDEDEGIGEADRSTGQVAA